jgi:hypothetical protein
MRSFWLGAVVLAGFMLTMNSSSQPPRDGRDGPSRPRRFELGRVLPPPLVEELVLTAEQQAEIGKLEKEVKERLGKILTAQQKKVENFRPRGPGGPPRGGSDRPRPGGDGDKPDPPQRPEKDPPKPEKDQAKAESAGIQWYATWESAQREAKRTGRPILLVSAAPHCAGVSGIW